MKPEIAERRMARLRQKLASEKLDAMLITTPENLRYLSGFTGSGVALVPAEDEKKILAVWFVYLEQAKEETSGWEVRHIETTFEKLLPDLLREIGARKVGFESAHLTVAELEKWRKALEENGPANCELVPIPKAVEELRAVKEPEEMQTIRRAVALADAAFEHILDFIRPGMTEKEVAWELEVFLRTHGAEKVAFDLIIGAGPNGAKPHATSSERKIRPDEPIVLDLGAFLDGYNSDLTRTIYLGQPDGKFKEIFEIVRKAQETAERSIHAGMTGVEADRVARQIIEEAGYGECFGHGLGHGVGLAVHEAPRLHFVSEDTLEAGMVVTIEPGIYLPDWGGVRLEDMALVKEDGLEVLTQAGKGR